MIASIYYEEIYGQLEKVLDGKNFVCILLHEVVFVKLEMITYESVKTEYINLVISKIIHNAWLGHEKTEFVKIYIMGKDSV